VRAGSDKLRVSPLGSSGFRWSAVLHAADPALYDGIWQTATLVNITQDTGRDYPREYPWGYAEPVLPNAALLRNEGNRDAPVYALYEGQLTQSALLGGPDRILHVAALDDRMEILVDCSTLTAEAAGGVSRASYILPGSRPMLVPAGSTARWYLRASGPGKVTLAWRSTWA
jgi:hypothetical protein